MVTDDLELDGADPIDSRLGGSEVQGARWTSHRPALGLAASPVPTWAALLTGLALGSQGLGILTVDVLRAVAPVTAAATVVLGVLIGLGATAARRPGATRLFSAAAVEAGVTLCIVTAAFTLVRRLPDWTWASAPYLPVLLGIAAASSAIRTRAGRRIPRT